MKPLYTSPNYCPLPAANPARAYIHSSKTDISRTLAEHDPANVAGWRNPARLNSPRALPVGSPRNVSALDDYDLVERQAWLDTAGGFRS